MHKPLKVVISAVLGSLRWNYKKTQEDTLGLLDLDTFLHVLKICILVVQRSCQLRCFVDCLGEGLHKMAIRMKRK